MGRMSTKRSTGVSACMRWREVEGNTSPALTFRGVRNRLSRRMRRATSIEDDDFGYRTGTPSQASSLTAARPAVLRRMICGRVRGVAQRIMGMRDGKHIPDADDFITSSEKGNVYMHQEYARRPDTCITTRKSPAQRGPATVKGGRRTLEPHPRNINQRSLEPRPSHA